MAEPQALYSNFEPLGRLQDWTSGHTKNYETPRTQTSVNREQWRESFNFSDGKLKCHSVSSMFTLAVLGSGGLLCTHSAIRAGWSPIWGTEICPLHSGNPLHCQAIKRSESCADNLQQQMWIDFTNTPCYGNTFSKMTSYKYLAKPMYMTAGPPCTFFCVGGDQLGDDSETGWMFADTALIFLMIMPLVFRVEQSGNVINVNDGEEVNKFRAALEQYYVLHIKIIECWDLGDNVHRSRWFCVGFLRNMGAAAINFKHPNAINGDITPYCARDIALPDADVPRTFWRKDNTDRLSQTQPEPGQIHKLARAGIGMGHSNNPNLVTSWLGATPGPTTFKGGVKRPSLNWNDSGNNPIGPARTDTPVEMCRAMSAPSDVINYYASFSDDLSFLYRNIGNAIAAMTCSAYDTAIMNTVTDWMLEQQNSQHIYRSLSAATNQGAAKSVLAYSKIMYHTNGKSATQDINTAFLSMNIDGLTETNLEPCNSLSKDEANITLHSAFRSNCSYPQIKSAMVDTGANRTFLTCDHEPWLNNPHDSVISIQVASKESIMNGSLDGTLHMMVLGPGKQPSGTSIDKEVTTVPKLERDLFSVDDNYRDAFNILLKQPDYQDGIPQMYKEATSNQPSVTVPFRYDWQHGGFWIDYIPVKSNGQFKQAFKSQIQQNHTALLAAHFQDMTEARSSKATDSIQWLSPEQVQDETVRLWAMPAVAEVFWGRHDDEREIRGVKAGLRKRKRELNAVDFHNEYDHMGCLPNCIICAIVSGSMRRVFRKIDPHIETRPMYYVHMDTITWSHRAFCGSRYEIHVKDAASKLPDSMYLYLRSDSLEAIEQWVIQVRSDPAHADLGYEPIQIIQLDNAGEWDLDYKAFQDMKTRLKLELLYTCKDRSESNPTAERSIGIKEPKVKAALMQRNLPPQFWVKASKEVNYLLARFPVQSQAVSVPIDGDRARPLEIATRGRYSRRQIDRELYYFVGVGTPCLVHDAHVKGSHLPRGEDDSSVSSGQKSRWMVADGMYREQVCFWDPKTNDTSRSKSYTAFKLRFGMNFAQLLNINLPPKTQRMRPLAEDFTEQIVIQLPSVKPLGEIYEHPHGPPVQSIKHVSDNIDRPRVTQTQSRLNATGSVKIINEEGQQMEVENETGYLVSAILTLSSLNLTYPCTGVS